MSETKRREVVMAFLQSPVTIPGVIDTASVISATKTPRIRAFEFDGNLWLEVEGKNAIIPAANVKIMLMK